MGINWQALIAQSGKAQGDEQTDGQTGHMQAIAKPFGQRCGQG
jgi:hypothetical protein